MKRSHGISLISLLLVALAIAHSTNLINTSASAVGPQADTDSRSLLGRPVTAHAAGRGNPWINLRDGHAAPAQYQGSASLTQQLKDNQTRPLSLASADFDEDGVPDIVSGYAGPNGAAVSLQRGDADTIYPNTREAIDNRARLNAGGADDIQSPFFVTSRVFDVPFAPDFLAAGDFDADGHRDVLAARRDGSELVLLSGDGKGNFAAPRITALTGRITALAAGDVNRIDGLADVMVAVSDAASAKLLVYEGSSGALKADPETISLPAESTSIAIGQLDNQFPVDIAVAAGREVLIVHGRDRKHQTLEGKALDNQPPVVTRVPVPFQVASLAVGDFAGDLRHEIALLSDDGVCRIFAAAAKDGKSWNEASAVALPISQAGSRVLVSAKVSSSPREDLLVLDRGARQLHMLIDDSAIPSQAGNASPSLRLAGTLEVDGEPAAALGMRLNVDALTDLVMLAGNSSAPTVIITSPLMTFSVTNTNDSGDGSLRKAIQDANGNAGSDSISFNIAGGGSNQTISPLSALPSLSQSVTIDGTTQNPGSSTPPIEVNGINAGSGVTGLTVTGGGSIIRGLAINRFDSSGIELTAGGFDIVDGCFVGTDAAGIAAQGNGEVGVAINIGSGHTIGGTTAAARNVVSSNTAQGILVLGPAMNNLVQGNYVGTNAAGTGGLGNSSDGVGMVSAENTVINCTIGGTTAGARNVISGNFGAGIQFLSVGTNNLVQGNFIGTNATATGDLGNTSDGVAITEADNNTIGGTVAGAGNVISGNGSNGVRLNSILTVNNRVQGNKIGTRADGVTSLVNDIAGVNILNSAANNTVGGAADAGNIIAFNLNGGVVVQSGTGNSIQSNSIFSNVGLGIDLFPAGVTPNDSGDGDTGANNLQNFPVLSTANGAPGNSSNITGTLNSTASTTFTLHFYASPSCDASGNGEGQTLLGSATTTTNASGNATFNVTLPVAATLGQSITATATNPQGNTSEFSACITYGAADLAVTKMASSATIVAGSNVTYTITVTNNGPEAAPSVTVTDNLAAQLTFVSCDSTGGGLCGGTGNNRVVTFTSLAPGASATITIAATLSCSVTNGAVIGNTASAASSVRDPVGGNNSASVNFTASNPGPSLSPTSASFAIDGGTANVSVMMPSGCGWQAMSNAPWITINSGSSGIGNGTVNYTVAQNTTGSPRSGTMTIAGLSFTVNQSIDACSFMIAPTSSNFAMPGGSSTVAVTGPSGCAWQAVSNDKWITVDSGSPGNGNGTVGYTVQVNNTGNPRTGTITIAGQTFTVNQSASACSFMLGSSSQSFGPTGGTGNFGVNTQTSCPWTAVSNNSWIHITSGSSGSGNGTVNYSVDQNVNVNSRTGTITVVDQTFTVNQSGIPAVGLNYFKMDFETDAKTEIGFYRGGLWGVIKSSQNYSFDSAQFFSWGGAGLQPIIADFDGDNKTDIGYIVAPSGGQSAAYAILKSSANYDFGQALFFPAGFPSVGDTPVVGDFDGDGKADPGTWRATQGAWIIPKSSANYTSFIFTQWGQLGDTPIIGEFDGDGKADIGFYRDGLWGVLKSSQNYSFGTALFFSWGGAGFQPIVGDFDGDNKTDIAYMVPPANGQSAAYAILKSSTNYDFGQPLFISAGFPSIGDTPVVGDYDGDGKSDAGIWRESLGAWIIAKSSGNYATFLFSQWGQSGDIALPNTTGKHP